MNYRVTPQFAKAFDHLIKNGASLADQINQFSQNHQIAMKMVFDGFLFPEGVMDYFLSKNLISIPFLMDSPTPYYYSSVQNLDNELYAATSFLIQIATKSSFSQKINALVKQNPIDGGILFNEIASHHYKIGELET